MEKERNDASRWLYERVSLGGIDLYATGAVLNHDTVPQGLYCYDVYTIGDKDKESDIFISEKPVEDAVGAVLSAEPLPFKNGAGLSIQGMEYFDGEYMQSLKDIVNTTQQQDSGFQMQTM
nr:LPD28 domain-containing protein [uncultured Eisenbergiella sp.]